MDCWDPISKLAIAMNRLICLRSWAEPAHVRGQAAPKSPGGAAIHCETSTLGATQAVFGFEAQVEMAATWKVGFYFVASLSAFLALLFGLFALSDDPIVGVLFAIGGMALLLYAVAGLCGAPIFKN